MSTKNNGILYGKKKVPKFQTGSSFGASDFQYNDSSAFGPQNKDAFGNSIDRASGFGLGSAPTTNENKFNPNSFANWQNKVNPSVGKAAPKKPEGYTFGNTKASQLTNKFTPELASNYVSPETKPVDKVSGTGPASGTEIAGAVAPIVGSAGSALAQKGDGDETTFTKKESANVVAGSALKTAAAGASAAGTVAGLAGTALTTSAVSAVTGMSTAAAGAALGSAVPLIGTAVGVVAGLVVGWAKAKKAKKKAKAAKDESDKKYAAAASAKRRTEVSERDATFAASQPTTGTVTEGNIQGYASRRKGGSFHYTLKASVSPNRIKLYTKEPPKKFKRGGSIRPTENIIPNGVLHEEFNKLGDKGMPVVKCKNNSCEKKYEIERDELIFTLNTTKKVEELVKAGDLKQLGSFVKSQLLDNTHSFTDKFNELNTYNKSKNESIYS